MKLQKDFHFSTLFFEEFHKSSLIQELSSLIITRP